LNHIRHIEKQLSSAIFVIRNIRYKINSNTALKLYDSLILPYLNYCNIVWGNTFKTHLKNLFRLQKRALKLCSDDKKLKSDTLFVRLNRLSIHDIYKFQTGQLVFNYFHNSNILPNTVISLFKKISDIHSFHTRSQDNLCLYKFFGRLNVRISCTKVYAPTLWNKIPTEIKQVNTLYSFKKQFKNYLQINSNI